MLTRTFSMSDGSRRCAAAISLVIYASALGLTACGGGGASDASGQVSPSATAMSSALPKSAKARVADVHHLSAKQDANGIAITSRPTTAAGEHMLSLQLPSGADSKSLEVTLNGKTVTGRFTSCGTAKCEALLTVADGVDAKKNVLIALAKTKSGGLASGRARFGAGAAGIDPNSSSKMSALSASTAPRLSTSYDTSWLAPTLAINTLTPGGYQFYGTAWIQVNGTSYPTTDTNKCGYAHYAAIVFDRQTLALIDQPCFGTGTEFSNYLKTLTARQLVVAGTTALAGNSLSNDVDTTSVGGTSWLNSPGPYPTSYMIIGAGQQAPGSAYEYQDNGLAFATGFFQEDARGNYSFQSSDVVEYAVQPADPSQSNQVTFSLNLPANLAPTVNGALQMRRVYTAGDSSFYAGVYLLILDRYSLTPNNAACSYTQVATTVQLGTGCGYAYQTGSTDSKTANQGVTGLLAALAAVSPNQLVILMSTGSPIPTSRIHAITLTDFHSMTDQIVSLGGTAMLFGGPTFTNSDNYALVGYRNASNALIGGAAEASTMLAAQGQGGVLHGTLQRNLRAMYQPAQVSQEPQAVFTDKGALDDPDFVLATAEYQQPVDWPGATSLLPGADDLEGQQNAFNFISHWLLAGYYMKGIQGNYQNDIHYFFSGSLNTWIDYHTFDPADLPFPSAGAWETFGCNGGVPGTICLFYKPGSGGVQSYFSVADFNAVKNQVSMEVRYLTNTLQFLSTGSTNLKDVVASGNANIGLALTGAAAKVLGSNLSTQNAVGPATSVPFSWQSLLGTLGGIATTIANAEGLGELTPIWEGLAKSTQTTIKGVVGMANTVGAVLSTVGSGDTIPTHGGPAPLPSPFAKFTTTIGDLASESLQNRLIVGFDTMADGLTSDWGRLSMIGPRVTNTADPVFFAPNQVAQNAALDALTSSASRNFYFALLPRYYEVQIWYRVANYNTDPANFQPTMGGLVNSECSAFYLPTTNNKYWQGLGVLTPYQGTVYPTFGLPSKFPQDLGGSDVEVIANKTTQNPNTDNTYIPSLDDDLAATLFAPDQLNTSMDQFIAANGPMTGSRQDASASHPSGFGNDAICNASIGYSAVEPLTPGSTNAQGNVVTATALSASVNTGGHDLVLTATVTAGDKFIPSGLVYFVADGKTIGTATVAANGKAVLTIDQAMVGTHSISAHYSPDDGFAISSAAQTLKVYAGTPDVAISAALTSVDASWDKASVPLDLRIDSIAGLTGPVKLSCTGLPAGMDCKFSASPAELKADGSVTASVIIGPSTATKAALGLLMFPLLAVGIRRRDLASASRRWSAIVLMAAAGAVALSGCGGGSDATVAHETGTKTVLVTATVGNTSRSVAIDVNIR